MDIQFRQPSTDEEFDRYVLQLSNYSFLLSSAKFNYSKDSGMDIFRYLVFDNEKFLGVVIGLIDGVKGFGKYMECKHNPILIDGLGDNERKGIYRSIFNKLIQIAREKNCFFVRISPLILDDEIYKGVCEDFKCSYAPIHPIDALISQYFDISKSEEDLRRDMSSSTRNNINKLLKNPDISIKIIRDKSAFDVFKDFYTQTKTYKGYRGKSEDSLLKEFEYQMKQNMLYFVVGYYKNKPIAIWQNTKFGKYMHVYQAGSNIDFRQKNIRITYLLFWETVKLCKSLGIEILDLFGGMTPEGYKGKKNPWQGVNDFKTSLGGKKITYIHSMDIPVEMLKYTIFHPYAKVRARIRGHTVNW